MSSPSHPQPSSIGIPWWQPSIDGSTGGLSAVWTSMMVMKKGDVCQRYAGGLPIRGRAWLLPANRRLRDRTAAGRGDRVEPAYPPVHARLPPHETGCRRKLWLTILQLPDIYQPNGGNSPRQTESDERYAICRCRLSAHMSLYTVQILSAASDPHPAMLLDKKGRRLR
jgi:hypothetical protein